MTITNGNGEGEPVTVAAPLMNFKIGVGCLVCGETVELNDAQQAALERGKTIVHICDECKNAILYARELLKFSVDNETIQESQKEIKPDEEDESEDKEEEEKEEEDNNGD